VAGIVDAMADTFTVSRSTTINAPANEVYGHVIDFRRWAAWSPWEEMDPNASKSYSGAESGVGSRYSWTGNRKVGKGSMEITDAKQDAEIHIALEFLKPFKASNDTEFTLTGGDAGTQVTWTMTGKKTFMTRVMGIFKSMDSMVGPDFEKGLAKLKALAEQ
jgi:hypothetical protein